VTNFTRQQHVFSGYITAGSVTLGSVCGSTDNQLFFFMCQRGGQGWSNFTFSDQNGGVWTRILEQDFDLADSATDRRSFAVWCRKVVAADLSTALTMSALAVGASGAFKAGLVEFSADGAFDWTLAAEEAIGNTADDTPASSFGLGSTGDPGTSDNFVFAFAMLKKNSSTNPTSLEFDIAGGANITSVDGDWTMAVCLEWSEAGLSGAQDLTFSWASDTNVGSGGVSIFTTAGGGTPVGLAAETDAALAVAAARRLAVGLAAETNSPLAATIARARAAGLAAETDSPLAATIARARAAGLAAEADSALAATIARVRAVGVSAESDAALALGTHLVVALGLAGETDAALAATIARARALGLASESNIALGLAGQIVVAVGLAGESDAAPAATIARALALALAAESDLAPGATIARARAIGLAAETGAALAIAARRAVALGLAADTGSALALVIAGIALDPPLTAGIADPGRTASVTDPGRTVTIN